MKSLGLQATQLELTQMMTEADEDGSGSIEFDEFLNMMKRKMKENENSIEDVKAAFKVFDQNGDGWVFYNYNVIIIITFIISIIIEFATVR